MLGRLGGYSYWISIILNQIPWYNIDISLKLISLKWQWFYFVWDWEKHIMYFLNTPAPVKSHEVSASLRVITNSEPTLCVYVCMMGGSWIPQPDFRMSFLLIFIYRFLFLQEALHYSQKIPCSRFECQKASPIIFSHAGRQGVSYNIIDPTDCRMVSFSYHNRLNDVDNAITIMK